jgi:hypothetical protein
MEDFMFIFRRGVGLNFPRDTVEITELFSTPKWVRWYVSPISTAAFFEAVFTHNYHGPRFQKRSAGHLIGGCKPFALIYRRIPKPKHITSKRHCLSKLHDIINSASRPVPKPRPDICQSTSNSSMTSVPIIRLCGSAFEFSLCNARVGRKHIEYAYHV